MASDPAAVKGYTHALPWIQLAMIIIDFAKAARGCVISLDSIPNRSKE